MNRVVFDPGRRHDHIRGAQVKRPFGHAIGGTQQHPDEKLVIGLCALCSNADIEGADAEREIADSDMRDTATQFAAAELHDVEMRALHRLLQAFEAVQIKAFDCEMLIHYSNAT